MTYSRYYLVSLKSIEFNRSRLNPIYETLVMIIP